MKKMMKALHGKKGFTLIECVIAIAVFAALTGMVLMIMSQTIQLSKKATDAETDLNNIVQNVVQDSTNKTYGDDTKHLMMSFGAFDDFQMTYSVVDGYKNYIKCPSCGKEANNLDYLSYIYDKDEYINATTEDDKKAKENFKISYWFGKFPGKTDFYQCPSCGQTISPSSLTLSCLSCGETGKSDSTITINTDTVSRFAFNQFTGSYSCAKCGGGSVVQMVDDGSGNSVPITKSPTADADFMVSGMASNAIRYGSVPVNDASGIKSLIKAYRSDGTSDLKGDVKLEYTPNKNASIPGYYVLTVSLTDTIPNGQTATVDVKLPGGYLASIDRDHTTTADGLGDHPYAAFLRTEEISLTDKPSSLIISGITDLKKNNIKVKFTLTNYANNNSFESDYPNEVDSSGKQLGNGLGGYWFASPGNDAIKGYTIQLPIADSGIRSGRK